MTSQKTLVHLNRPWSAPSLTGAKQLRLEINPGLREDPWAVKPYVIGSNVTKPHQCLFGLIKSRNRETHNSKKRKLCRLCNPSRPTSNFQVCSTIVRREGGFCRKRTGHDDGHVALLASWPPLDDSGTRSLRHLSSLATRPVYDCGGVHIWEAACFQGLALATDDVAV